MVPTPRLYAKRLAAALSVYTEGASWSSPSPRHTDIMPSAVDVARASADNSASPMLSAQLRWVLLVARTSTQFQYTWTLVMDRQWVVSPAQSESANT